MKVQSLPFLKGVGHVAQEFREATTARHLWIVGGMLGLIGIFHFLTPPSPFGAAALLAVSHTVYRILMILPVAAATVAFGRTGGVVTLGIAMVVMLGRIALLPTGVREALVETMAVGAVGYVALWMIETQEHERKLRQKAVERLEIVNAITMTLSESLDLEQILDQALAKVLEVAKNLEPKGGIFILDERDKKLRLRAHRGLSPEFVKWEMEIEIGHCVCGRVAETGEVVFVEELPPEAVTAAWRESHPDCHIVVPLTYQDRVLGVMFLYGWGDSHPNGEDRELFAALGRQIGAAIENARLYQNLRFYLGEITRAQEEERKRIARELHDDTAQGLIELSRRLDDLASSERSLSDEARHNLEALHNRIDELARGVRRFIRALRSSVLDDLGLMPALEVLISELEGNGTQTDLEIHGEPRRLAPDTELALYRIVQESLSNVKRHAEASRVVVSMDYSDQRVRVAVQDNGCGFEISDRLNELVPQGKLGLTGMGERAKLLGGTLLIHSAPGKGTIVLADVPA